MNTRNVRMWQKWLTPGIGIKRWLLLFIGAATFISLGFSMGIAWMYTNFNFPHKLQPYIEILTLQHLPHPWREMLIVTVGLLVLLFTLYKLSSFLIAPVLALDINGRNYTDLVLEARQKTNHNSLRVVAIGGGTGLSALLRGLKLHDIELTAIVTVADDGGSTGRIRDVFNIPAPGDIRNCMVAMADDESLMSRLFHYRFDREGSELTGHAFGNLFITALSQISGSFDQAVIESHKVLNIRGKVLPSTTETITLCAEMEDGQIVRGESALSHDADKIREVFLTPRDPDTNRPGREAYMPQAYEPAITAILQADLIVMGPGSLYTSVVPNLLVNGIREAILWSPAATAYVCNVATQHGETDDMGYEDHVQQILNYLGEAALNYTIVNDHAPASEAILPEWQVTPLSHDGKQFTDSGVRIIAADVVSDRNPLRHDPVKLAQVLIDLARGHQAQTFPQSTSETA